MTNNNNTRSRGFLSQILLWTLGGQLGCVGTAIAFVMLIVLAYIVIKAVVAIVKILLIVGALVGLAITIRNYALALYHNIKPEKVTQ